jgi:hypothetical protein
MTLMVAARKKLPIDTETEVLVRSRRRCALCYGIKGDFTEKIGQIAHIDKNRSNDSLDNLAWLCFEHHSLYDSSTSQHKNYQATEIKHHRDSLYTGIATSAISGPESMGRYVATEDHAYIVWLPHRIIVWFDWPLRCAPTLYVHPRELIANGKLQIEEMTVRGFQAVIEGTLDRKSFAFFADASPTEYKKEANLQREEWGSDLGDEGAI